MKYAALLGPLLETPARVLLARLLYWIRPTAHLATRLSSGAAYGRRLPLYAATLSAPST
jgi:hypothetical protein